MTMKNDLLHQLYTALPETSQQFRMLISEHCEPLIGDEPQLPGITYYGYVTTPRGKKQMILTDRGHLCAADWEYFTSGVKT